jgi:hypothetical protein
MESSIGSSRVSKPFAKRNVRVLLPKAIKNPNIAKSFSKTCTMQNFNWSLLIHKTQMNGIGLSSIILNSTHLFIIFIYLHKVLSRIESKLSSIFKHIPPYWKKKIISIQYAILLFFKALPETNFRIKKVLNSRCQYNQNKLYKHRHKIRPHFVNLTEVWSLQLNIYS